MQSDPKVELHVAVDGDDVNDGSSRRPFATLVAARDAIRREKTVGGVAVQIHAGDYLLSETFVLSAKDSGTESGRIVYRAAGDGEVRVHGGSEIKGFEPFRDGIYKADVRKLNLPHNISFEDESIARKLNRFQGDVPGFELFFGGKRMVLARWPNKIPGDARWGEWAYIPKTSEETKEYFHYAGVQPERWTKPQEAQVHFFPWYNYHDQYTGIGSVDTERGVFEIVKPAIYTIQAGRRYYVQNVFEELDAPGEWYYDRDNEVLYFFYPPEARETAPVVASLLDTAIKLDNASNVTIRDITIETSCGEGVLIHGGRNNIVGGCTIRNVFRDGIHIRGGRNNGAIGNEIYETGMRGICLEGGDRQTLIPAGNYATNNHIHHMSCVLHTYTPGVQVEGCGNLVSNNLIHDGPHMVVGLAGNDHIIEYNEIHHAMHISSHGGAFYCGRDFTARGNIVRYNSMHDIHGYGFDHVDEERGVFVYSSPVRSLPGAFGIHLDDQMSGFHIHHNVFYRLGHGVVRHGGGRDTIIENNIFFDAGWAVHIDNRGMGWQKEASFKGTLADRLGEVDYRNPPWSDRYPELVPLLDDRFLEPVDNVVRTNIFYQTDTLYNISRVPADRFTCDQNVLFRPDDDLKLMGRTFNPDAGGLISLSEWQDIGFDTHSVYGDPRFIDPDSDDYRLDEASPALELGFEPIPFDKIGLYCDEYRKVPLPPPDPRRDTSVGVTEDYPIPGWQPGADTSARQVTVTQSKKEIVIDGHICDEEYGPADATWRIGVKPAENGVSENAQEADYQAWVTHDVTSLYVAVRSLVTGRAEGVHSARIVLTFQNRSGNKPGSVLTFSGRLDGEWESNFSHVPGDGAQPGDSGVAYSATVRADNVWEAEWRIRLDVINVTPPRPAFDPVVHFNIEVCDTQSGETARWREGDAETGYPVGGALKLVLPHGG